MLKNELTLSGFLPLYNQVAVLDSKDHAMLALRNDSHFGFARQTATIPITLEEFERAALDYPIAFVGETMQPVIVVGLAPGENLFVSKGGSYAPGAYIPAYLRRYPFVLAPLVGTEERLLCIDMLAERLGDVGEEDSIPLFQDGEPSPVLREAAAFCHAFDAAERRTRDFVELLIRHDLLETTQAHYRPAEAGAESEPQLLLEYAAATPARLDALDAMALVELRDLGVLPAVYAQLLSSANWDVLTLWAA